MNNELGIRNILFIDTSNNTEVSVGLDTNGEKKIVTEKLGQKKAQVVLPMIENLLKEHGLSIKQVSHIEVNVGPGSYTGLRVGATIANTLSYLLKVPVNKQKAGTLVDPIYS